MGIRIQQYMGWGLKDLNVRGYNLTDDDRINPDFDMEDVYGWETIDAFMHWLHNDFEANDGKEAKAIIAEANGECGYAVSLQYLVYDYIRDTDGKKKTIQRNAPGIVFSPEFGSEHVLLFHELVGDCVRYDNTMDYYLWSKLSGQEESTEPMLVDLTDRGAIYPQCNVIKKATAPEYKGESDVLNKTSIMAGQYNRLVGRWAKDVKPMLSGDDLTYALDAYRPDIPEFILLWTHYIGIFKDWKSTVQELRPMIYIFWS